MEHICTLLITKLARQENPVLCICKAILIAMITWGQLGSRHVLKHLSFWISTKVALTQLKGMELNHYCPKLLELSSWSQCSCSFCLTFSQGRVSAQAAEKQKIWFPGNSLGILTALLNWFPVSLVKRSGRFSPSLWLTCSTRRLSAKFVIDFVILLWLDIPVTCSYKGWRKDGHRAIISDIVVAGIFKLDSDHACRLQRGSSA